MTLSPKHFAARLVTAALLALPAVSLPVVAHAQGLDQLHTLTRDELDVIKVLTRQEDAWNKGDLDSFVTGYKNSPDILFVGRQISRGYDQMVADYKHNYPTRESMGTLSYTDLEPHLLDERFAVVLGHYRLERSKKNGGNADGVFSLVLEKTDKGWKIVVDHPTG
jgi:ketosteroid isomerase-like protein